MSTAKKASWIVAASMATVEALKDQAGLCRWNYALKSVHQHAKASLMSFVQVKSDRDRFISATASSMGKGSGPSGLDDKRKMRQAEKAENVRHLVCWGPN